MIYTIGYQRLEVAQLDAILDELDADLVDVRSAPHSRRPEFRKAELEKHFGSRYIWKGDVLGGIPKGATTHRVTDAGIDWLKCRERNVLLMCAEHHPGDCHRHLLIAGPHFPEALHIWEGGLYRAGDLTASYLGEGDDIEAVGGLGSWR
jgi:uncharacterized protein (DUF488 family)